MVVRSAGWQMNTECSNALRTDVEAGMAHSLVD